MPIDCIVQKLSLSDEVLLLLVGGYVMLLGDLLLLIDIIVVDMFCAVLSIGS